MLRRAQRGTPFLQRHDLRLDLEFRPGTVDVRLNAAYTIYLGRSPSAVTPPAGWDGLARWVS